MEKLVLEAAEVVKAWHVVSEESNQTPDTSSQLLSFKDRRWVQRFRQESIPWCLVRLSLSRSRCQIGGAEYTHTTTRQRASGGFHKTWDERWFTAVSTLLWLSSSCGLTLSDTPNRLKHVLWIIDRHFSPPRRGVVKEKGKWQQLRKGIRSQ